MHIGHLSVIHHILEEFSELVIVIGSAQISHELNNPLTAGERIEMLRLALNEAGIDSKRIFVVPVSDVDTHGLWVSIVKNISPKFDIVFSNEPLTRRLFKESDCEIRTIPFFKREIYSATEVRRRMLKGENWEELVPKSVAKFLKKIDCVARIRELTKKDALP